MKRRLFGRPIVLSALIATVAVSCQYKTHENGQDLLKTDFIYLDGKSFKHENETFFPLMVNYVMCLRSVHDTILPSASAEYECPDIFECHTCDSILNQIEGHFQLIKELGFNSIRLCFDRISIDEKSKYYYKTSQDDGKCYISKDYRDILSALEKIVNIASKKDLRVMLLIRYPIDNQELYVFTKRILKKFHDNPTVFAYDFMNEPLYFDPDPQRSKQDAARIVTSWKEMMRKYAPNQLLTIGFAEPIEVFAWDPEILPVDFLSFHTYHPLRVKNETYWFSTYISKPWMIGETSLPADNDSIPYQEQTVFMREFYSYVRDCGGAGFGWWNFQDVTAGGFDAIYSGLLNHQGKTYTKDGRYCITGSLKPVAKQFAHLPDHTPQTKMRPVNYYNIVGYKNILLKGTILDERTHSPIEGAVIRGWNEDWSIGMNTFTDENGAFTLYCNDLCTHFEISAPAKEKLKFSMQIECKPLSEEYPDMRDLPDRELEYQSISYHPFLRNSAVSVFDFDSLKFRQAKFSGDMGTFFLQDISESGIER